MKSRTSSCNTRVLRKDLTRFAPIWVEYSAFLLLVFYISASQDETIGGSYSIFLGLFAFVNAIYGFVVAIGLFGYLSDPRECSTVHTFPIRREEYFIVHLVAGFFMALIPNALFCLVNLPMDDARDLMFIFAGLMLEFTCFYGLAIFSIFLTGRKFAAATVYALLNWLSVLVLWALEVIYLPLLPGVVLNSDLFFRLCPVVGMCFNTPLHFETWRGISPEQLHHLTAYAIVGVVLIVLSLFLYRRRKLEYAGDFLAVKWLTPVFLFALSFACGCVLGVMGEVVMNETEVMLVLGLVIGYFTGLMLMKKSVKVFRLRSIAGSAAIGALVLGSMFLTELDPLNRVNYVPQDQDVAMVEIAPSEMYFDNYVSNFWPYHTEDPQTIGDLTRLHDDILKTDHSYNEDYYQQFMVRYHLKNGRTVIREYQFWDQSLSERASFYYSQPEAVINVSTLEELRENCKNVTLEFYDYETSLAYTLSSEDRETLMKVFFEDCKAGNMKTTDFYTDENSGHFYISFQFRDEDIFNQTVIPASAQATRTLCQELLEKYSNAEKLPNEGGNG